MPVDAAYVAVISVVPGTLAALAAWRAANKAREEMRTGNGVSAGGMIVRIHESQLRHETDPNAHPNLQPNENGVV